MEEFFERLNEFHKKYSRYFKMLILIAAVFLCIRILPYATALFLPFIIGWVVSFAASPLVKFLKKKLRIPYRVGAVITVLMLLTILALIVVMLISLVSDASAYIAENWEWLVRSATEYINSAYQGLLAWSDSLPFDFMEMLEKTPNIAPPPGGGINNMGEDIAKMGSDIMKDITSWIRPFAGNVATGTISVVKSLPEAIIFIVMLMLSTYFFTSGKERFARWYQKNVSDEFRDKMYTVKTQCFGAILGMLRAQLILTLITALELFIGFLIMGVDNAATIAVVVAIVDLLPVLGVGTVLIPWALINLLAGGSIFVTVGMIILYFICLSVRNIIQPKILGESIGISSLASLVAIWVGYKVYGFLGMIIMPVIATLLYKFYEVGLFDWFFLSHKEKTEKASLSEKGEKS